MPEKAKRLSGFGRFPWVETHLLRPERIREVPQALSRGPVIGRGLGRAYGDAAVAPGGRTVSSLRLNRFLSFDAERGIVEVEGGVRIDELIRVLLPRGYFPSVVPGTRQVTVAGALACDIHGKDHHRRGSFSRHVLDFELFLPSGDRITVTRERDEALFLATAGGMGLTGFISRLRLRLLPVESAWMRVDTERTKDFEEALERFHASDASYDYSVAWIDCLARGRALGRSVLLRGNFARRSDLDRRRATRPFEAPGGAPWRVPWTAPPGLLRPATVRAFNTAYYHAHPKHARDRLVGLDAFFFPLDRVADWNRLYGPRGFLQYQLVVPEPEGALALRRILERLAAAGAASFLAVLKRFGPAEPGALLSFPRPGYTLALDLPNRGEETFALLRSLDRIVLDAGGRVYLAKDARLDPLTFRRMYPEYERWLAIRRRVDPEGRLASALSRRLEIP
ncbi:MAG: FAD-binding oxidoreductase [Deltaproteobacteria bacterium]|nr:MAG: FAD-binding oxidoreductase [Deltaproteobacteria bacterium]